MYSSWERPREILLNGKCLDSACWKITNRMDMHTKNHYPIYTMILTHIIGSKLFGHLYEAIIGSLTSAMQQHL